MDHMLQDTISIGLTAETVVTNDTVKIVAKIVAQVQPGESQDALPARVREMMNKIVADADWKFSNVVRVEDATGFERVTLTASARVPEKENFLLEARCKEVSTLGLRIASVEADISIPSSMIEQANRELRVKLASKAAEEAESLSKVIPGEGYRVSDISFASASNTHRVAKSLSYNATANYAGDGDTDAESLGNSQRVSMSANITLARIVPLHSSYM